MVVRKDSSLPDGPGVVGDWLEKATYGVAFRIGTRILAAKTVESTEVIVKVY